MAIYWLNSESATPTAPYATKETGAHTIEDIRTETVVVTDTIMVARGSVTTDSVFNGPKCELICNIIAEDDGVNSEETRPVINYSAAGPFFAGTDVANSIDFTGIKFVTTSASAPAFVTSFTASNKYTFTDCIIIADSADSVIFTSATPADFDKCVIQSDANGTTLPLGNDCTITSSTIISNTDSSIISGQRQTLTDVVLYSTNAGFNSPDLTTLNDSTFLNVIWFAVSETIVRIANLGTQLSITDVQNVDPKISLTTYLYDNSSPALGNGTLLDNIGWDQYTVYVAPPVILSGAPSTTPMERFKRRFRRGGTFRVR